MAASTIKPQNEEKKKSVILPENIINRVRVYTGLNGGTIIQFVSEAINEKLDSEAMQKIKQN